MRVRLYIAALMILVAGLAAGATIYLVAQDEPAAASYVIVGGVAYAVDPGGSKMYVRELQRFGGKASVLFDEFNRWFAARWRGRQLGVTLAVLAAALALILAAIGRCRG
jgi:hypothetical protein